MMHFVQVHTFKKDTAAGGGAMVGWMLDEECKKAGNRYLQYSCIPQQHLSGAFLGRSNGM